MNLLAIVKAQFELRIYEEGVPRIEKCLSILSSKQIWAKPNDHSNSIGHLILHLCGNVTQWIGSGIGGEEDTRQRDDEFGHPGHLTHEQLISRLRGLKTITDRALDQLKTEKDLLVPRSVQGFNETNMSILIHVIEHFSYHTGQIAWISKSLADQDLGFYEGLDLNQK